MYCYVVRVGLVFGTPRVNPKPETISGPWNPNKIKHSTLVVYADRLRSLNPGLNPNQTLKPKPYTLNPNQTLKPRYHTSPHPTTLSLKRKAMINMQQGFLEFPLTAVVAGTRKRAETSLHSIDGMEVPVICCSGKGTSCVT